MTTFNIEYAHRVRVNTEVLKGQVKHLKSMKVMCQALDSTNVMVAVLNSYRQIVYANKAFIKVVEGVKLQDIIGQRPGEVMCCKHSHENEFGCGASEACKSCIAFKAFLTSMQSDEEVTDEAVIVRRTNGFDESMNFQVHVVPFHSQEEDFYIMSFIDRTDTVKRRFLEKVFFHDVINTTGAIKNYIGLLKDELPEKLKTEMEFLEEAFQDMLGEIQEQKQLLEAENGELTPNETNISSSDILHSVKKLYERNDCGKGKVIAIVEKSQGLPLKSDYVLLRRVLCNMLKNALEESEKGEIVNIGYREVKIQKRQFIEFWVNNKKYMPPEIQHQIFNKAFTTKGNGRGLGTYSMKLLGERYLKGIVGFISDQTKGTTFYIKLPL